MQKRIFFWAMAFLTAVAGSLRGDSLEETARQLKSADPAVRLYAVKKIAVDFHGQGQELLLAAVVDEDEYVRERAVQALAASGLSLAAGALEAALADRSPFVRWRALQGLTGTGARVAVDKVGPLVTDPSWRVRVTACAYLGQIALQEIRKKSIELNDSPEGRRIRDYLAQATADGDERVRLAGARALARNHDGAAFAPLVELLQRGSLFTRDEAALGLGDLGDRKAVEPLIAALEARENRVSDEGRDWAVWGAASALEKITGESYRTDSKKWKDWLEHHR